MWFGAIREPLNSSTFEEDHHEEHAVISVVALSVEVAIPDGRRGDRRAVKAMGTGGVPGARGRGARVTKYVA
jgi:hypothetical protein